MDLKDAVTKAVKALTDILDDSNSTQGAKLEASREILKYSSAVADLEQQKSFHQSMLK